MVGLINNSTIEIANRIEKVKLVHEEEALWSITVRLCTLSAPFTDRFVVGFKFKRYPENPCGLRVFVYSYLLRIDIVTNLALLLIVDIR